MPELLCVLFLLIDGVGLAVGLSAGIVFSVLIMIVGVLYYVCKKRQTVQTQVVTTTPPSDGVSTVVATPPSDGVSTGVTLTAFTTTAPHVHPTQRTQYKESDAQFSSQVAPPSYDASTAYPSYIPPPPQV